MDFEKVLLNPSSEFASPRDILSVQALSHKQKIQLLRIWEYDAREMEVAEEENMAGGAPSLLSEILEALHYLGSGVDTEHTPPTKQG